MKLPVMLGDFSSSWEAGADVVYEEGTKNLQVLQLPDPLDPVSLDLKDGYKPMSEGGLWAGSPWKTGMKGILHWVLDNRDKLVPSETDAMAGRKLAPDFLTSRGALSRVMASPFLHDDDGWCIGATKFKGTIYMCKFMTDAEIQWEEDQTDRSNLPLYCGLRFEKLIADSLHKDRDVRFDADHFNDYYCVVKAEIGGHNLVFSAEQKCVKSEDALRGPKLTDYTQIKTMKSRWKHNDRYKNKMRWWCDNCLTGTDQIVCGWKDEDSVVRDSKSSTSRSWRSVTTPGRRVSVTSFCANSWTL